MYQLNNDVPAGYLTPPFPSLYWFFGPRNTVEPVYLYRIRDVWRYTLYWTLIVFEAAHLAVALYAVVVVWWGSRHQRVGFGRGRQRGPAVESEPRGKAKAWHPRRNAMVGIKNTGISGMWAIPLVYGFIAGVEALCAGSLVGWLWVT